MAKTKIQATDDPTQDLLNKQFGEGSVMTLAGANDLRITDGVSTGSLKVDDILGGHGFAFGRFVELVGLEGSGKTSLSYSAIANAQKRGMFCVIVDAEQSVDPSWAENFGVDLECVKISQPNCGEEGLTVVEKYLQSGRQCFIVVDSIAALVPKKELEGEFGDVTVGLQARMMSQACKKLTALAANTKSIVLWTNQIRCLSNDSLILTGKGLKKASEVKVGDYLASPDGGFFQVSRKASSVRPSLSIGVSGGKSIVCSHEHRIMSHSSSGDVVWEMAGNLSIGSWVASPLMPCMPDVQDERYPSRNPGKCEKVVNKKQETINEDLCEFIGMWFSDGSVLEKEKCFVISEKSQERRDAIFSVLDRIGWPYIKPKCQSIFLRKFAYDFFRSIGCESGVENKRIPNCICGERHWRAFFKGFFDSHFNGNGLVISFFSEAEAKKAQIALLGLGMESRMLGKSPKVSLTVTGIDLEKYANEIGFAEPSKANFAKTFYSVAGNSARGKADVIPVSKEMFASIRKTPGWKLLSQKLKDRITAVLCAGNLGMSRRDAEIISATCKVEIKALSYRWNRVKKIHPGPEIPMTDFEIPASQSLIADGICVHNSTIGPYQPPETNPGGRSMKFYASQRLDLRRKDILKDGATPIGIEVKAKCIKNKVAIPFRETLFRIYAEGGIRVASEVFDLSVQKGFLEKSGAWVKLDGKTIAQGEEGGISFLEENPDVLQSLITKIKGQGAITGGDQEPSESDGEGE